jgi:hypothetical protein
MAGLSVVTIPRMTHLLKDMKAVEDYAQACQSRAEARIVRVTREEADVIDSFRRLRLRTTINREIDKTSLVPTKLKRGARNFWPLLV